MSEFISIAFDGADQALAALGSVRALEKEDKIHLKDTAVVSKDADGKVSIKNEASSGTETGAVVGAALGGLLFLIFPVAGIVGGAVVGGLIGRSVSPGVDGGFVNARHGRRSLLPGTRPRYALPSRRGGETGQTRPT